MSRDPPGVTELKGLTEQTSPGVAGLGPKVQAETETLECVEGGGLG